MASWEENKKVYERIREICKEFKVKIIVVKAPPLPRECELRPRDPSGLIFIDGMYLLKK